MEKEQSGTEDEGLVQENVSKEKDKSLNEMKMNAPESLQKLPELHTQVFDGKI